MPVFDNNSPIRQFANPSIGIAPGRLDVMGGIADYSGSLLLQMPIAERTMVRLEPGDDWHDVFIVESTQEDENFEIRLEEIAGIPYRELGPLLKKKKGGSWAVYIIGCFAVLKEEKGLQYRGGRIRVNSEVPIGKGVSSSASLEVATMHAICKAYDFKLDPIELALLAQKVENLVVGAACGLMDQLSVNLGREDHLLPIICQPHEIFEPIAIPEGVRFFGLDSGVRHAVSGASYSDVRTAAFMAFTVGMIRNGIPKTQLQNAVLMPFGGFWANVSLEEFHAVYEPLIPKRMKGSQFLQEFGVYIDHVTQVDPDTVYSLYNSALHPVAENSRIRTFLRVLQDLDQAEDREMALISLGILMLSSHEGYNSVGLGEPVTNRIVELVRERRGMGNDIYGARISGGGSGGTVTVIVGSDEGYEKLLEIKQIMEDETGKVLKLFEGSSDGGNYIN
jgi:galactokinase